MSVSGGLRVIASVSMSAGERITVKVSLRANVSAVMSAVYARVLVCLRV